MCCRFNPPGRSASDRARRGTSAARSRAQKPFKPQPLLYDRFLLEHLWYLTIWDLVARNFRVFLPWLCCLPVHLSVLSFDLEKATALVDLTAVKGPKSQLLSILTSRDSSHLSHVIHTLHFPFFLHRFRIHLAQRRYLQEVHKATVNELDPFAQLPFHSSSA